MGRYFRVSFLLFALSLSISGCAVLETQFAESAYGIEIESMMNTCMDMQKNGRLPGIKAGEDKSIEFTSDSIEFSKRNEVTYPIQLNCVIINKQTFPFIKQSSDFEWQLSQ